MTGRRTLIHAALLCLASGAASSHEADVSEGHHDNEGQFTRATMQAEAPSHDEASRAYFTDLPLIDQHGNVLRFYTDVLKDRVVLINFVYTTCEDACPLITYKLVQVKKALGERFGNEVFFVSISIDPTNDTPEAMLNFARQQKADGPGWVFLTGETASVTRVVKKLGQYKEDRQSHSTLVLVGNVKTRHWAKIRPTTPSLGIVMQLEELARELGS